MTEVSLNYAAAASSSPAYLRSLIGEVFHTDTALFPSKVILAPVVKVKCSLSELEPQSRKPKNSH